MGQHYPYQLPYQSGTQMPAIPNQQASQGYGAFPSGGFPPPPPPMPGMAPMPGQMPPTDADSFMGAFPGPREMALGAAAGVATVSALNFMQKKQFTSKVSHLLDRIPLSKNMGKKFDQFMMAQGKKDSRIGRYIQEFFMTPTLTLPSGATAAEQKAAVETAVRQMEQRKLGKSLENFQKYFKPNKKTGVNEMGKAYQAMHSAKLEGNALHLVSLNPKQWPEGKTFAQLLPELKDQIAHLKGIQNPKKPEKRLIRIMENLFERVDGMNNHIKPSFESQAFSSAKMSAEGVGLFGRTFGTFMHTIQRIFSGSTVSGGPMENLGERVDGMLGIKVDAADVVPSFKNWASNLSHVGEQGFFNHMLEKSRSLAKILGAKITPHIGGVMIGVMIFGTSFKKAHDAKDGDKTRSFFHDLLGVGIANFIGWEFGKQFLGAMNFSEHVFGKSASNRLPGFLRKIPFIGTWTLGAFAVEILAMTVFGGVLFQPIGEKISHLLFGKPRDEKEKDSLKGTAQQVAAPGMNAALAARGGGLANNAIPHPGMAQPYPTLQPGVGAVNYKPQLAPGTNDRPASAFAQPTQFKQPVNQPVFSITPEQIRHNLAAEKQQGIEKNIESQYKGSHIKSPYP